MKYNLDGFYWFHWIFLLGTTIALYTYSCSFEVHDMNSIFVGLNFKYLWLYGIITFLTALICFVVGIPIRRYRKLSHWWHDNPKIIFAIFLSGIALYAMSTSNFTLMKHQVRMDGEWTSYYIANPILQISGWLIVSFCALHYFPNWTKKYQD